MPPQGKRNRTRNEDNQEKVGFTLAKESCWVVLDIMKRRSSDAPEKTQLYDKDMG